MTWRARLKLTTVPACRPMRSRVKPPAAGGDRHRALEDVDVAEVLGGAAEGEARPAVHDQAAGVGEQVGRVTEGAPLEIRAGPARWWA